MIYLYLYLLYLEPLAEEMNHYGKNNQDQLIQNSTKFTQWGLPLTMLSRQGSSPKVNLLHRPYLLKKTKMGGGGWSKISDFETKQFMDSPKAVHMIFLLKVSQFMVLKILPIKCRRQVRSSNPTLSFNHPQKCKLKIITSTAGSMLIHFKSQ